MIIPLDCFLRSIVSGIMNEGGKKDMLRIGGKEFKYRKGELQFLRTLLGDEHVEKRREIIDHAEARGLFCKLFGDCDSCDGDCKKSPVAANASFAPAVA